MINAGIVGLNHDDIHDQGVAQGSVLSPFLFNVYMNKLDDYMEELAQDAEKSYNLSKENKSQGIKAYKTLMAQFSAGRIHSAVKKYASIEALKKVLREKKQEHFKKYGRARGIDLEARHIQYVRYADNYLVGIVGPKKFAEKTRDKVNEFVKSNLHLQVNKDTIINRNEHGVKFLGFMVYLANFNKKTKSSSIRAAAKYKRRVIARLARFDAKQAHTAVYAIKKLILNAYRSNLENGNLS